MKIIVLGSGGWFPSKSRNTSSYLIEYKNKLFILDAGTGISNLNNYTDLLKQYNEVHIILSHYHIDHIVGLCYLPNWFSEKKVNIYGPGEKLGFDSCRNVLSGIIKAPYFASIEILGKEVCINDYDLNGFKIDDVNFKISEQIHTGNSFGITIDDCLHYATDTIISKETFEIAKNVKLLLHDSWILNSENARDEKDHSSIEDIVSFTNKFNINKVGLVHINPNWDSEKFETANRMVEESNIFMAEDCQVIEL